MREDVVRIDHDINSKMHLMGHWIHDQMSQTIIPSIWSGDNYDTVGTVFANPSWSAVIKLTQTLSPSLLNETSFDVNGNTIDMSPTGTYAEPSGWSATGFFTGNNADNRLPQLGFAGPLNTTWTTNYTPWHNAFLDYQVRDDLSWNRGLHGFKFGYSYMRVDKNQQLQADTQGDYSFGTDFSGDSYSELPPRILGLVSSNCTSLNTNHWDQQHLLRLRYGNYTGTSSRGQTSEISAFATTHCRYVYEKNNRVANFVPGDFSAAQAQVPNSAGNLNPTGPGFSQLPGAAVPYYLNGIELAGVNGFPRGIVSNTLYDHPAACRFRPRSVWKRKNRSPRRRWHVL